MIDAHSHITITSYKQENEKNINNYIKNMTLNGIDESIVTINPFIGEIKCPNDSTHFVKMLNGSKAGHISCKCTNCKKIIYEGIDPYICYNNYLIERLSTYNNIHVYPVISVTNTSMQWLIDYYKDLYGDKLEGIKAYTGLSAYSLDELEPIVNCDFPMLVHAGTYDNQNPNNMLKFIKKYKGIFQIAHFAGLELSAIEKLNKMDNVLIDISPAYYIYKYYVVDKNKGGIFNKDKINSVDDMYEMLLSKFDLSKIVWGSDVPYSNQKLELLNLLSSKVFSDSEKQKILSLNMKESLK